MKLSTHSKAGVKRIFFLLSITVCFLFQSHQTKAQCGNPVFYEGFELGTIAPTWTALGTFSTFVVSVNTNTPNTGNFKLQMTGLSQHLQGIYTNFAVSTPTIVSWYIYPHPVAYASNYFVLGDASVSYSNCLVFACWMNSTSTTGSIRFVEATGNYTDFPTSNQQWHHIELRNINYTTRTSDIWINNTLFTTAFPFRSTTLNNVSQLHLYNLTAQGTSSWDDIMLGNGLFASLSASAPSCFGFNNGSSTVTPVGGQGPYTYSWSSSATSSVATNLAANIVYTAQITDANSCIATRTLMLSTPPSLSVSLNSQSVTCFGSNNGSGTVITSGGQSPYTYSWSTTATSSVVSNLAANTVYSVLISDANSCISSKTLMLSQPPALSVSINSQSITCFGNTNGQATVSSSGGTGQHNYMWSTSVNGSVISNVGAGIYSVSITDVNACTALGTVNIAGPAMAVTVSQTITNAQCFGIPNGSASLQAVGGTGVYSYSWTPTGSGPAINNLAPGNYTCIIRDQNLCAFTTTFSITSPPALSASLGFTNITCISQGAASASISGGTAPVSYSWMPGGAGTPLISNIAAGIYTLTTTDGNGCVQNFTVQVGQNTQAPILTVNSNKQPVCKGESVIITATGNGNTYLWSDGSTTASIVITPTSQVNYSVSASFTMNGCSSSANFTQLISECTWNKELQYETFAIYPNPTGGRLTINSVNICDYHIYSVEGRLVQEGSMKTGSTSLDLNELSNGIYLIVLRPEGQSPLVSKIIKE